MATSDSCHKDWGFFASSVGPGRRNPSRAASRGRVVRPWGTRENVGDSRAARLSVRPYASIPLVEVVDLFSEGLSRTLVAEMADEIVHRVSERTCPRPALCRNQPVAVAHARKMPSVRGRSVLDGGEMTVCRLRVTRSLASEVNQTC